MKKNYPTKRLKCKQNKKVLKQILNSLRQDFTLSNIDIGSDNSVAHFSIDNIPEWKFGIWVYYSPETKRYPYELFGQVEILIDKFKPSRSDIDINDISLFKNILNKMKDDGWKTLDEKEGLPSEVNQNSKDPFSGSEIFQYYLTEKESLRASKSIMSKTLKELYEKAEELSFEKNGTEYVFDIFDQNTDKLKVWPRYQIDITSNDWDADNDITKERLLAIEEFGSVISKIPDFVDKKLNPLPERENGYIFINNPGFVICFDI